MTDKQDFRPVKVKIKSNKQKSMKYISGDLLYSGVNLFGKLSEIYMEKIKNGEMFGAFSQDATPKDTSRGQYEEYETPAMIKKGSNASVSSQTSYASTGMLKSSKVFQLDQEILSLFRKLQKKDAVTKVKALNTLQSHIKKVGDAQSQGYDYIDPDKELSQVLTFFLYHFERIITYEIEKSVREAAHEVLGEFLVTCKKNFAQHIVNLFPLWYISFYDTAPEIKTKAKNNFLNTFKTPEVRSALFRKSVEYQGAGDDGSGTTISQNFLYFIHEKITHFDMLLAEDMTSLDKPQREAIFDRIISGCLEALADSFEQFATLKEGQKERSWTPQDTKEYINQVVDVFGLNSTDSFPQIYKFMGAKYSPSIRAAALKLLLKMSTYMISNEEEGSRKNKEMFEVHIHKIANSLFSAIADESSQVQKMLWKSLLFDFCTEFNDIIWQQVDIKKGVLPQLHTCLKNAGFGAHADLYKNFVAFASIFPVFDLEKPMETSVKVGKPTQTQEEDKVEEEKIETDSKAKKKGKKKSKETKSGEGEKVIKNSFSISEKIIVMFEIMKSLFSGISVEEAIAFNDEVINSYYETMSYLYLKKILPAFDIYREDEKTLELIKKKSVQ